MVVTGMLKYKYFTDRNDFVSYDDDSQSAYLSDAGVGNTPSYCPQYACEPDVILLFKCIEKDGHCPDI